LSPFPFINVICASTVYLSSKWYPYNNLKASSLIMIQPSIPVEQTQLVVLTVSPIKEN